MLPRLVGPHKAREWMMLGDVVTADEAHRLGAVNRLAAPEAVLTEARAIAAKLAAGPRRALGMMKQMVNCYGTMPLAAALDHEADAQARAFTTEDFREGVAAFKEKRPARFGGT
ncbi:MAG: enoyl-CoA hydratase-related protein [Alphaproteobacteria bacterium]|nr:enoyl-CoA hydratase-related protein [Alphaproteobacteria bacterium]